MTISLGFGICVVVLVLAVLLVVGVLPFTAVSVGSLLGLLAVARLAP